MSAPVRPAVHAPRFDGVVFRTLFVKEVRRFAKVWIQTVLSPLVTTSLYFLVFGVALGSRLREVQGVPYVRFVVPGLVMLAMVNNAFLNCSSSLFQSKINGTVVDLLVAPMGAAEALLAYVGAALVRATLVGGLVYLVAGLFTTFAVAHPLYTLAFALLTSVAFACLGLVSALWAQKFDQLSIVPNFVLTPLTFLGGVFYSIAMLPAPWDAVSRLNPLFYMVSGLRYGLLGRADADPATSLGAVGLTVLVLVLGTGHLLGRGYNLRT